MVSNVHLMNQQSGEKKQETSKSAKLSVIHTCFFSDWANHIEDDDLVRYQFKNGSLQFAAGFGFGKIDGKTHNK